MLALGVAIVGSVLGYVKFAPADRIPLDQRRGSLAGRTAQETAAQPRSDTVQVPVPRYVDGDLQFERRPVQARPGADHYALAINEFLKEARLTPSGARVLSTSLRDGNLLVDFSKEFDQTYGTEDEQTLVNGILTALGQFREVSTVELRVEGKEIETLGNIDLTAPLPVIRSR